MKIKSRMRMQFGLLERELTRVDLEWMAAMALLTVSGKLQLNGQIFSLMRTKGIEGRKFSNQSLQFLKSF